ncbi:MAG: hypothetical protein [Caudoviricetes sp.]|nr:MAG: hypothetical protein [Caudoviricetes sp.]
MAHNVICQLCRTKFDRDKEPWVEMSPMRYAHKVCADRAGIKIIPESQEEKDLKELELYIKKLLNEQYINANVRKQIMQFRKEYGYSYTGILKCLKYWYDIKGNPKSKANHNIGIVPYIWNQAKDYYYMLYLANNLNADKEISDFKPKIKNISIPRPQHPKKRIKLFELGDGEDD